MKLHEELQDKVGIAADYANIDVVLANSKSNKATAMETFSKGLELLKDFEEKTGYHHPLIDTIPSCISELQKTRSKRR